MAKSLSSASGSTPPDECANCGASIPRHARACPECGADDATGWRETSIYDGLDLPGEDEGTMSDSKAAKGHLWYWWAAAAILALALGLGALGLR